MTEIAKKYKIAMLAPVPFYYQVSFFQKLAKSSKIDFTVYFCSDKTINKFMDKEKLLDGYNYKFLRNHSPYSMDLGIWKEIKNGKYDAVILQAWNNFAWWLAFLACLRFKTPVLFLTDANNL